VVYANQKTPRPPVPRPPGVAVYSFLCPRCDMILGDGVAYTFCPVCDAQVDWVDLRAPVWCCPTCDEMVNEARPTPPSCTRCALAMNEIHAWERPPPPKHVSEGTSRTDRIRTLFESPVGIALFAVVSLAPALSFSLDPRWRWLGLAQFLPVVLIPLILGSFIIGSIAASLRELRDLIKDRRTRIIHGIEHATVAMLLRRGFQVRGGQTDNGYFKLWLESDQRKGKRKPKDGATEAVRRACSKAIEKLRTEKWSLAIHPKCGTTWMVLFLLASIVAIASVAIGLFTTLSPKTLVAIVGTFFAFLALGSRPLGYLLQRTMTIAVDFKGARVKRITRRLDERDVVCYYVHLQVDLEDDNGSIEQTRSTKSAA